ncbi:Ogr/Delta-like zinc finger protein [Volucribacter psittacicida]|uniref:Ogr/Delta-like zinc finger protein n=1 Tax=Volucribacter psittacicida TaxID=203482 RepID=A0A4R1G1C7_9PAST|nr:ogr/Delta-like zinc finger family protein [Volucribacter psittacicida]TCJ98818.1 Ogr/Delta-like zinc finger protein [Volucribacter psittacicida]
MARTTNIYCKICGSKSVVTRTERMTSDYSRLYCSCRNPDCRHKFVMNLEFSHSTSTSQLTKDQLFSYLIKNLSVNDKKDLKKLLDE